MTVEKIAAAAKGLNEARKSVTFGEWFLQKCVSEYLSQHGASLRDMAAKMGLSAQYLCDIRGGRRKVSDAVVQKLRKL